MQGASGCTTAHFAAVAPGLACLKMKPGKQWEISWNKRDGEGKRSMTGQISALSVLKFPVLLSPHLVLVSQQYGVVAFI